MERGLKGWIRPRPIRIAFLIEEAEHHDTILDAIFADCYNRWGGRFSLIVPCHDAGIPKTYWPWLEAYDPDIVYSYVSLDRAAVLEIHERLAPSVYTQHDAGSEPQYDVLCFRPKQDLALLSSLSTIFRLARHTPGKTGEPPVRIIDSHFTEAPSRFFTDNFGSYIGSRGSSVFPPDAAGVAVLLPVVSPERATPRHGVPADKPCVSTELEAFQEFAKKRATSLSQLSIRFAPKLDTREGVWSGTFNLVIGEKFADRVLFWNARLRIPQWLDDDVCCLRVSLEQLRDDAFLGSVGEFLKGRNHVNGGTGGQSQTMIRSTSLSDTELQEALLRVQSTKPWGVVRVEKVTPDAFLPSTRALENAREGNRFGENFASRPDWQEFEWSGEKAYPPSPQPDHLADAPHRQHFVEGAWASDVRLEHPGPGPRFTTSGVWVLPKRWRISRAFALEFNQDPRFSIPLESRRGREGVLTIFPGQDRHVVSIRVPTDFAAIQEALVLDGAWIRGNEEPAKARPRSKAAWMRLSNEARYFNGVVGMAGSLSYASQLLLHPFLQSIFIRLGGASGVPEDRLKPVLDYLGKRSRNQSIVDLTNAQELRSFAMRAVNAADRIKRAPAFMAYSEISEAWEKHRLAYWEAHPQDGPADETYDWEADERRSLDRCLVALRSREMMYQGYNWLCPNCHHRNWVDMSRLTPTLACEVCKHAQPAPVTFDWLFRPNEFLIEGLRSHSVLSVLWAATALYDRARQSVVFVGSTQFGVDDNDDGPAAEADILAIVDGKCVACEVKTSWRFVGKADIEKLVTCAQMLRPDRVILAVMDEPKGANDDIASAKARVEALGVEFELLTRGKRDDRDRPYLDVSDIA